MTVPQPSSDVLHLPARSVVLGRVRQMRQALYGDTALFPVTPSGDLDHERLAVEGLDFYTGNLDTLPEHDLPRLGVLVDTFKRFIPEAPAGIRIAVLDRGGDLQVEQIDCHEPYPAATEMVRNAIRTGTPLRERTMPRLRPLAEEMADLRPNLSEKVIERMVEREVAESAIMPAAPAAGTESSSDLRYVCPTSWQGHPVPERAWWLPGLIPMRQVTIINGDGGVGKSLLALQLACAGALGVETLGTTPLAGRVMYLGAEDEESEFHRRTADIVRAHDRVLSDLNDFMLLPMADMDALLSTPDRKGVMQPTPLWNKLWGDVLDFQPKLLVLDTAADLFGGDEIKRNQTRQFIGMLRRLAIKADCAAVLLAHPSVEGMKSGTGSSGSTAWNNSVRSRLYLTDAEKNEDPDVRTLTTMKANYGKKGSQLRIRYSDGAFTLDDGTAVPAMMGMVHRKHDEKFVELLSKMNRLGQTVSPNPSQSYAPRVFSQHPDGKGITKAHYQEAMHRLLDACTIKIVEEGPNSRRYKRLYVTADMFGGEAE
ncbi:AAA domain-containing protein [Ancylobacter aquaticus]|uniref:AAA domain-containing protein n=1 Tax=Ancylobacter aquaticus TaxID=100 RepID=A0A4R1IBX5_ANCAQ|nr:AAA family ATPase [Ancylobacter aquaticus]TCK27992.1 AAA domain-containing protein [Ancylobacter aquaticus]